MDAIAQLAAKVKGANAPAIKTPPRSMTFYHWLQEHGAVRLPSGKFVRYSFDGRYPLFVIALIVDYVLGNDVSYADEQTRLGILGTGKYGTPVPDAELDIGGGAQWGKSILMHHLQVYLGTVKFMATMYALPDDNLVSDVVDQKLRPEVLEHIPYVADMLHMGKDLTKTGRAVNKKGAMLFTDGVNAAVSMMRGLTKVPTTFSADVAMIDERDDVDEFNADFLTGRLTSSALRFLLSVGTMRYEAAGQNAALLQGSMHIGYLTCLGCGKRINPEENWPDIARMQMGKAPSPDDPQLATDYTFKRRGETVAKFDPQQHYYFGCPSCGAILDREKEYFEALQPERMVENHWSVRVSQMCCAAFDVRMWVARYCAIPKSRNPRNALNAFRCDALASPSSGDLQVSKGVLDKAEQHAPYSMTLSGYSDGGVRYAGFDTGEMCHGILREIDPTGFKRTLWAEAIPVSDLVDHAMRRITALQLACLFIDAGPERDKAREIALRANGLRALAVYQLPQDWYKSRVRWPSGVEWDGRNAQNRAWRNLKAAPVEFTGKPGDGIRMDARYTPDKQYVCPVISCNRDEAIQALLDELLTADAGLCEVDAQGELRTHPLWLLPQRGTDEPAVSDEVRRHILTGARTQENSDGKTRSFVDKVANHYLLAAVYARLAEVVVGEIARPAPSPMMPKPFRRGRRAAALRQRRKREVMA